MGKIHHHWWKNSAPVEVGSSSHLLGFLHPTNSRRMSFIKSWGSQKCPQRSGYRVIFECPHPIEQSTTWDPIPWNPWLIRFSIVDSKKCAFNRVVCHPPAESNKSPVNKSVAIRFHQLETPKRVLKPARRPTLQNENHLRKCPLGWDMLVPRKVFFSIYCSLVTLQGFSHLLVSVGTRATPGTGGTSTQGEVLRWGCPDCIPMKIQGDRGLKHWETLMKFQSLGCLSFFRFF